MVRPWTLESQTETHDARLFRVRREVWRSPRDGASYDFAVLDVSDWVNVVALTDAGRLLMIRQFRVGSRAVTLEIPGGGVEAGEDRQAAAARELLEETGYAAERWSSLGSIEPNPAFHNNRCHTFLAEGARRVADPHPDTREDIEVEEIDRALLPELIRSGAITHALVTHALLRFALERGW